MNKKSGKAGSPVDPVAPAEAKEADAADPGQLSEIKAKQRQLQSGKYGSTKAKPFKPQAADTASSAKEEEEKKKECWIEIELVGEDDKPISGEKYRVTLPDGSIDEGSLDQNGWARVEGFEEGSCKVTFPDLDQDAWEFLETTGPKKKPS
jgi:hypothetical protein